GARVSFRSSFLGVYAQKDKNCTAIWEAFKVVLDKDPCSVRPSDYDLFINLSRHSIPRDKSLFWENNHLLVMSYAENGHRVVPLCNVLYGRLGDFLNWCRQTNASGLDYQSCPTSEDCENNPVDSFWRSASIQVILGCTAGETHVLPSGPSPFQSPGPGIEPWPPALTAQEAWPLDHQGNPCPFILNGWRCGSSLCSGFSYCRAQALECRLSSWGSRTYSVEYHIYHILVSIEDCQLKKMASDRIKVQSIYTWERRLECPQHFWVQRSCHVFPQGGVDLSSAWPG
ncbi:hypothetical protein FD754_019710, partial [Muntiacus muntjak]